jgi:hypothetical protein|tara:strand:- start:138 stop:359 length:222 start_codon:yes stop_codon:yes gene_type:complete
MEGPLVKYLILLILTFDGSLVRERLEFNKPVSLMECLAYGNEHREAVATYNDEKNTWLMNDKSGTWQGYMCSN